MFEFARSYFAKLISPIKPTPPSHFEKLNEVEFDAVASRTSPITSWLTPLISWASPRTSSNVPERSSRKVKNFYEFLESTGKDTKFEFDLNNVKDIVTNEGLLEDIAKRGAAPSLFYKLLGIWSTVNTERREFRNKVRQLEAYYLIDVIFNTIASDALTPDVTDDHVVTIQCSDEEIQKELVKLQERFNFDEIVVGLSEPLLKEGDYILRLDVKENEGLVEIFDDVEAINIITSYDRGYPDRYFQINTRGMLEVKTPKEYAHFCLRPRKLSNLKPFNNQSFEVQMSSAIDIEDLSKYIRTGTPILENIIPKIKDLLLLELLIPAIPISNLAHGSIIGVQVPSTTTPEDALKIIQRYEDLFNKQIGISQESQLLTASDIIGVAGRYRIVPIYSDKGNLQTIDVKNDSTLQIIMSAIDTIRSLILTSVGIPPSVIFGGTLTEGDALRLFNRYTRKLKGVQKAVASGLVQIAMTHLANCGKDFGAALNPRNIQVIFRNQLVNIDEIQKLEFMSQMISNFSNLEQYLQSRLPKDEEGNPKGSIENMDLGGEFTYEKYEKYVGKTLSRFFSGQ